MATSALEAWLAESGARFDGVRFGESELGGNGTFATRSFATGDVLMSIPRSCILSAQLARGSELGSAVSAFAAREGLTSLCTDAALLWIYMAVGRTSAAHPFHAYLAALPEDSPDPACWSAALLRELENTPAGPTVAAARTFVQDVCARLVAPLRGRAALSLEAVGVAELLWARGMWLSRAFPAALGECGSRQVWRHSEGGTERSGQTEASGEDVGCLLPLLDLTNHRKAQPIIWIGDGGGVRFVAGEALCAGEEIYNNYGPVRTNEELLFSYGFCQADNLHDGVLMCLVTSPPGAPPTREKFYIHRAENGGIPLELLQALARVYGEAADDEDAAGEVEGEEQALELGAEEIELLLSALERKLAKLLPSTAADQRLIETQRQAEGAGGVPKRKRESAVPRDAAAAVGEPSAGAGEGGGPAASDDQQSTHRGDSTTCVVEASRRLSIAAYREGQRDILHDAVGSLRELLGG